MTDPSKPYTPTSGGRSNKLDEIASVAWNQQVAYILAGASNTGYTVVWDLRGKREVVALSHGGNNSLGGPAGMGGRRGMSDIAWHPNSVRCPLDFPSPGLTLSCRQRVWSPLLMMTLLRLFWFGI